MGSLLTGIDIIHRGAESPASVQEVCRGKGDLLAIFATHRNSRNRFENPFDAGSLGVRELGKPRLQGADQFFIEKVSAGRVAALLKQFAVRTC